MADVFSAVFAAEKHTQWSAGQYAWDPSQLHALPSSRSPGTGSDGAPSEHFSEGHGSSAVCQRDQSLGPLPVGWQEAVRCAAGGVFAGAAAKDMKGAHTRAPKGPLVCQVEGCGHDLSLEKGYYQRYRVCEPHMKLLSLVVNGKACRFCQQCGRFQELIEFDGNKRSCRARLLQHNARRRKRDPLETSRKELPSSRKCKSMHPWSDSSNDADMNSHGSGDVSHGAGAHDKMMLNYSMDSGVDQGVKIRLPNGHVSSGTVPAWASGMAGVGGGMETPINVGQFQTILQQPLTAQEQQTAINSDLARCFSGGVDLVGPLDDMLDGILNSNMDYLEDPRMALQPAVGARDGLTGANLAYSAGMGAANMSSGFATAETKPPHLAMMGMLGVNSSPAHSGAVIGSGSFTSSVPTSGAWQPGGMVVDPAGGNPTDLAAALNKRAMQQRQLQEYQLMQQQQQQQQQFSGVVSRPSTNTGGSSSMMQMDTYINSNSSAMSGGYDSAGMSGGVAGQFAGNQAANRRGMGPWGAANASNPVSGPEMLSGGASLGSTMSLGANGVPAARASASATSSFDLARRLVASGGAAAQYQSEDLLVRVSIKIANCTPDQLPVDLYQRLRNLLNTADASLVQGFLRPGCTHLVLDVHVSAGGADEFAPAQGASLPFSAKELRGVLGSTASRCAVLVQMEEEVALWPSGAAASAPAQKTARVADLQASGVLPVIEHVSAAAHIDTQGRAALLVYGVGLVGTGVELFARIQGGYLPVTAKPLVVSGEASPQAAANPILAAAAAAAIRCGAALQRAGRKFSDIVLVTVDEAPGTGLLVMEAQAGPLLSNWRPCLLSTDAVIASELSACDSWALRAGSAALASLEAFVTDLGRVLDKRSYSVAAPYGRAGAGHADVEFAEEVEAEPELRDDLDSSDESEVTLALVCFCERLLGWASDVGMARVSTFLASALQHYGQDVQSILEAPYADGLAVVHRCVRSGNAAAVRAVAAWVASSGVHLDWGSVGALGLSPLHLAALVPATWRSLAAMPAARKMWAISKAPADGATPQQLQRMLIAQLPPGTLKEVVEAFVPKPRVVVAANRFSEAKSSANLALKEPACRKVAYTLGPQQVLPLVFASQAAAKPAATSTTKTQGRQLVVLAAVLCMATVLILSVTSVFSPNLWVGWDAEVVGLRSAQRFVPGSEYLGQGSINCCASVLYVGLFVATAFLLPVKTAARLLAQVHPASTCLGAT